MKRVFSIVLIVVTLFSCVSLISYAQDDISIIINNLSADEKNTFVFYEGEQIKIEISFRVGQSLTKDDLKYSYSFGNVYVDKVTEKTANGIYKKTICLYFSGKELEFSVDVGENYHKTLHFCVFTLDLTEHIFYAKQLPQYGKLQLNWNTIKRFNYDGFVVQTKEDNQLTTLSVVDKNTTSVEVEQKPGTNKEYYLMPFIKIGEKIVLPPEGSFSILKKSFFCDYLPVQDISVTPKSGEIILSWNNDNQAENYIIYRSVKENEGFKKIAETGKSTIYKDSSIKNNTVYYYYIRSEFGNNLFNNSASVMVGSFNGSKTYSVSLEKYYDIEMPFYAYYSNWIERDRTYFYEKNSSLHLVYVSNGKLTDITYQANLKYKSKKVITLPKFDEFGAFYAAPDNHFYVAIGNNNRKQSDSKTVIQVLQYDANWKLIKTASIKGNATNQFKGIYNVFLGGNCSMCLQNNHLYLYTAREMYQIDGIHHQSNIAFHIDTNSMTVKENNYSYVSHSFNQIAKFNNDRLFLLDQGDGYPRSLRLTQIEHYNSFIEHDCYSKDAFLDSVYNYGYFNNPNDIRTIDFLNFLGSLGDNYTGATVTGLEISSRNAIIVGTSEPQKYQLKNATEDDRNVYVAIVDTFTGDTKVIFLTDNNCKKSGYYITDTRLIKINDDRYVILYNTRSNKDICKGYMHYVLIDKNGNQLYHKAFTSIQYSPGVQPILYHGGIVLGVRKYNKSTDNMDRMIYLIPVDIKVKPYDLTAKSITTDSIKLTWSQFLNAKSYQIYQSNNNKTWRKIGTTSSNSFSLKRLKNGTVYYYKIKALDDHQKRIGSDSNVLKTCTKTKAPAITLKSPKAKTVVVSWKKVDGAKSYIIYSSKNNKTWKRVANTTRLNYTIKNFRSKSRVYVKTVALNSLKFHSDYSKTKSVTVK